MYYSKNREYETIQEMSGAISKMSREVRATAGSKKIVRGSSVSQSLHISTESLYSCPQSLLTDRSLLLLPFCIVCHCCIAEAMDHPGVSQTKGAAHSEVESRHQAPLTVS